MKQFFSLDKQPKKLEFQYEASPYQGHILMQRYIPGAGMQTIRTGSITLLLKKKNCNIQDVRLCDTEHFSEHIEFLFQNHLLTEPLYTLELKETAKTVNFLNELCLHPEEQDNLVFAFLRNDDIAKQTIFREHSMPYRCLMSYTDDEICLHRILLTEETETLTMPENATHISSFLTADSEKDEIEHFLHLQRIYFPLNAVNLHKNCLSILQNKKPFLHLEYIQFPKGFGKYENHQFCFQGCCLPKTNVLYSQHIAWYLQTVTAMQCGMTADNFFQMTKLMQNNLSSEKNKLFIAGLQFLYLYTYACRTPKQVPALFQHTDTMHDDKLYASVLPLFPSMKQYLQTQPEKRQAAMLQTMLQSGSLPVRTLTSWLLLYTENNTLIQVLPEWRDAVAISFHQNLLRILQEKTSADSIIRSLVSQSPSLLDENIDEYLMTANKNGLYESQILLMNYRTEHCRQKSWSL